MLEFNVLIINLTAKCHKTTVFVKIFFHKKLIFYEQKCTQFAKNIQRNSTLKTAVILLIGTLFVFIVQWKGNQWQKIHPQLTTHLYLPFMLPIDFTLLLQLFLQLQLHFSVLRRSSIRSRSLIVCKAKTKTITNPIKTTPNSLPFNCVSATAVTNVAAADPELTDMFKTRKQASACNEGNCTPNCCSDHSFTINQAAPIRSDCVYSGSVDWKKVR